MRILSFHLLVMFKFPFILVRRFRRMDLDLLFSITSSLSTLHDKTTKTKKDRINRCI